MDVPVDILKVLRCTSCDAVLSRGPVFQTPGGEALCGCCVKPGSQASRCLIYEAAAKLLRFPCRNQSVGCKETVPFAFDKEETTHEIACTHRQHLCPVLPAGRCDWLGPRRDMLEHCTECHPALILLNSAQLTHDITTSSLRTFLLPAFHALFLLHTKVCVTSGKIYHAVRRLGDPVEAAKFDFTVDVKRGKQTISKCSSVAPSGCLAIQEDTSLPISINSLLEILGGFDGVLFTVTIFDTTGCKNCNADLPQYIYSDHRGWLCTSCAPPTRPCRNHARGCNYSDFIKKCEKHEIY